MEASPPTGGMGGAMEIAVKHLATKISRKTNQAYSVVMGLMRCRFAFAMMRSALICLRGSRSKKRTAFNDSATPAILATSEARIGKEGR